jgi:hypothetical protein
MKKYIIPDVFPIVKHFYSFADNSCGGSLHIVFDDGNIDDGNIEYCIQYAKERNDYLGMALGLLLLNMSKTQRGKINNMIMEEKL